MMSSDSMRAVRALIWNGDWKYVEMRSFNVGLGENAMKNCESHSVGDEGVTMMAGNDDFSLASGKDKSNDCEFNSKNHGIASKKLTKGCRNQSVIQTLG